MSVDKEEFIIFKENMKYSMAEVGFYNKNGAR